MIKRILVVCSKNQLLKPEKKSKPERFDLSGKISGKKALKKELYSLLLEIMQEEISKSVKGG